MDAKYKLELNSSELCRGCLERHRQLTNLMCNEIVNGHILAMPDVYQSVTGLPVQQDDGLPQKLCVNCSSKIIEAYALKEKCIRSEELLREILNLPKNVTTSTETIGTQTEACSQNDVEVQATVSDDGSNEPASERADYDLIEGVKSGTDLDDESIECISIANYELYDDAATDENVYLDDGTEIASTAQHRNSRKRKCSIMSIAAPIDDIDEMNFDGGNKEFDRCSYCNKKFSEPSDFQSHVNEHIEILPLILTSTNFFRCSRCRLVYPSADQLCKHIETADSCTHVAANDTSGDNYIDYQFLGDPITNNIDQIRMFSGQKNNDGTTDGDAEIVSCEFCDYSFEHFMDFIEHFNDVHLTNVENTEELYADTANLSHCCGICAKTYMNIKDIMFHVHFHQTTFYCPFVGCSDTYHKSHYLNRHIAREHFTIEKHKCEHCQLELNSYKLFKAHLRHECSARKFICTTCGKRFLRKSTLMIHQRIHSDSKLFKCDMCEKGFAQSTDLKNHIRTHTDERPFECGVCGKTFRTRSNRADHVATHVGENQFQCKECNKTFKSARILRGHSNLHAERNFSCEICGKKFGRRYHVKVHMKTHDKRNEANALMAGL